MADIPIDTAKQAMRVLDRVLPERSPEEFRRAMMSPEGRAMAAARGWRFEEVAPDVYADVRRHGDDVLFIEMIESGAPGKGNVGRWLDSLADQNVIVTAVISERLEGILRRRGFELIDRADGHWGRAAR